MRRQLGPFVDCTSNQVSQLKINLLTRRKGLKAYKAIAYHELIRLNEDGKPLHAELIEDAVDYASAKRSSYPDVAVAELAVETMMVKLALRIVPYLKGYSHIQTNPKYSYNKQKTIENAKRT